MTRHPWWPRSTAERRMLRQMTACLRAGRLLQSYLDGEIDEATARRVAAHVKDCRRCGLEASVYEEIHQALVRRAAPDAGAVDRLRAFGASLLDDPPAADGNPGPPRTGA